MADPAARKPQDPAAPPAPGEVPVARFRLRVTRGGQIAVGPGRIELLEAVRDAGSISAAARSLDMSYRRAWMLLDELNHCLRAPVVESVHGGAQGGGSRLTETGRDLVRLYRNIELTAARACRDDIEALSALLAPR
jgi:molybdate transport system regulatory protein